MIFDFYKNSNCTLVNLGLISIFAHRNNSEKNLGPITFPIIIGMVRAPKGPIAQLVRAPDS